MSALKDKVKTVLVVPFVMADFVFSFYSSFLALFRNGLKNIWTEYQKENLDNQTRMVRHDNGSQVVRLEFHTPNAICRMRADTFSTKEPETLDWIDRYGGDGALFDIGANIGLYSIYYAKTKKQNVYCFEPSVFNLGLLAKNSFLNKVHERIRIIPNPLSDENGFANFTLSTTDEGGALSSFQVDFGWDGKPIDKVMTYLTAGFSLDYLMENGLLPEPPSLVKIDVDGFEHVLLRGAVQTISQEQCRSVLIEINDRFQEQAEEAAILLRSCGFELKEKVQSAYLNDEEEYQGIYNQIWLKA